MDTQTYFTSVKYIEDLQQYLDTVAEGSLIVPALEKEKCKPKEIGKRPMFSHSETSKASFIYTRKDFDLHKTKCIKHGALIILSKDIIVVDVDDEDYVDKFLVEFPVFAETVSTQTTKGRHFYFMATEHSRDVGMKDGARQLVIPGSDKEAPVDIKTMSATGNGGLISIPPSLGKSWINDPLSNPILEIPDDFVDLYKSNHKDANKNFKTTTTKPTTNTKAQTTYDLEEIKTLLDVLDHNRCDSYDAWVKVGLCLHNTNNEDDELMQLWDEWSQKSLKYSKGDCHTKWKTFRTNTDKSLMLGSLHAWAKADNPYAYLEIMNARVYNRIVYGTLGELGVAEVASKIFRGRYVCTNSKMNTWYMFDGTLWEEDENAAELKKELVPTLGGQFKKVLERYRNQVFEEEKSDPTSLSSCADKSEHLADKINDVMNKFSSRRFIENVVALMSLYLLDKKFEEKLDSRVNLLAFTNGVYDLETGKFRPAVPEDYLSICVGYEYQSIIDPDMTNKVLDYWEKMHPNKDQRDYLMKTLARQLYGDSGRELFHIHAGKGGSASNGKTTMFQLLETILGEYVRKTQVSILTAKSREEASKPQPEYAYWRGRRMLYVTEPEQSECLHSGIVKDLTGGEKITFRQLYSNKYVTFRPQHKIHLMCNDTPKVDGTDDGIKRRMRKIDYISRFVDADEVNKAEHKYQIDHSLFKELQISVPLRMAFLRHLLDHFDMKYNFEMPDSIRKTCECYLKDNDGVAQFADEFIVKALEKDAHFTLKDAKELFTRQEYFNGRVGTLKTDLEKILKTPCLEQKRVDAKNKRCVYMGYNIKLVGIEIE